MVRAHGYAPAFSPAQILSNITPNQRCNMRTISQEESINTHIKAPLMHKIKITNSSTADGNRGAGTNTVKHSCHQDPIPSRAMSRNNVCDSSKKVAAKIHGTSTVYVCKRGDE